MLALKETNTHGNVFTLVEQAKQAASEAEKAFDRNPTEINLISLNKCNVILVQTLNLESEFWKQKSNCKWLEAGEINTEYFRSLNKKKTIKSKIHRIGDNNNDITNPNDIKASAANYFSYQLTQEAISDVQEFPFQFPQIAESLPQLISPSQSGFVSGRMIGDNKLLAQEMVHSIDHRFIHLIKNAIENCWFTVLINGETAGFFKSSRGLRQDDLLSPALFILVVEALSRGLDYFFKCNPSMLYQSNCRIPVTHLSFADDIIIFTNSEEESLMHLTSFLEHYETISGQKINHSKSVPFLARSLIYLPIRSNASQDLPRKISPLPTLEPLSIKRPEYSLIELDAMQALNLISCQSKVHGTSKLSSSEIRKYLSLMKTKLSHIYKEGNQAVDFFANCGCSADDLTILSNDQLQG
ncbi:UNVERIFIED_CONTAM: hypothetical protein Sradi_2343900 [Sesamum radiatum]|uniref:Reverse transcriptase domain-containing protein n=1 Tax=Sesamum radiatum TaxID=300843 RepID=A0AAW2T8N7_SESRA